MKADIMISNTLCHKGNMRIAVLEEALALDSPLCFRKGSDLPFE